MKRVMASSLILLTSWSVWAQGEFSQTPIKQNQSIQSEEAAQLANLWGLETKDYIRYTEIIKGPLGRWNTNIDPILALGIYAESEHEKRNYAELYAKQEYALTLKTQAFQREYRLAFNRLYPNSQIIENEQLQPYYFRQAQKGKSYANITEKTTFEAGDRILYFPKLNCQSCDYEIKNLYTVLDKNPDIFLDIYLVNAKNEADVRTWASNKGINIDFVKENKITLNVNDGLLSQLNKNKRTETYLYLSRGEEIFKIQAEQIGL